MKMIPDVLTLIEDREVGKDLFLFPEECGGVCERRRCPLLLRPGGVNERLLGGSCPVLEVVVVFLVGGDGSLLFTAAERWSSPL